MEKTMREFIFCFFQERALELSLNLEDLLFLDYFYKFSVSGVMRFLYKGTKKYFKLTYKKIMDDLPILRRKERQIREMITKLEGKKVLERLKSKKNEMYIFVDFELLFGENSPSEEPCTAIFSESLGENDPTIEEYNNNLNNKEYSAREGEKDKNKKIKIKDFSGEVCFFIDQKDFTKHATAKSFEKVFKEQASEMFGEIISKIYYEPSHVTNLSDSKIEIFFPYKNSILESLKEKTDILICSSIKSILSPVKL